MNFEEPSSIDYKVHCANDYADEEDVGVHDGYHNKDYEHVAGRRNMKTNVWIGQDIRLIKIINDLVSGHVGWLAKLSVDEKAS